MSSSKANPSDSYAKESRQGSSKGRKNSRNLSEDDDGNSTTGKGNLKSLPQSTDKHSEKATNTDQQNISFSKPQPKVSFVEVEEMYRGPVTKYKSCKKSESKFKTATRKLQRLLLKPFDYDANLS